MDNKHKTQLATCTYLDQESPSLHVVMIHNMYTCTYNVHVYVYMYTKMCLHMTMHVHAH